MSLRLETWGPKLFRPGDMTVTPEVASWAPEPDLKEHLSLDGTPLCFLAWGHYLRIAKGWWFTPDIPIKSLALNDPNATNFTLTNFQYNMLVRWGGPNPFDHTSLLVEVDATRVIDRELSAKSENQSLPLSQNLTGSNIRFGLFQHVGATLAGSWAEAHLWGYKISGMYETTTPLQARTLTLHVYDPTTAKPIEGATATLLAGITTVDTGKTDSSGMITLQGFNKTYGFKVYASGYTPYPYEDSVDLTLGDAGPIDVSLIYVGGGFELPWWWWLIPIGIGGVAVTWFLVKSLKGPERREPPVYVVRG